MNTDEIIQAIKDDPEFELVMRRFAMSSAAWREKRKQEVLAYLAKKMDEVRP